MKLIILNSLISFLILITVKQDNFDVKKLLDKNWNIYRTVEVISGETRVYDELHINKSGDTVKSFNSLGGLIRFTTDSTGFYLALPSESFMWKAQVNDDIILIKIDSLKNESRNQHFFGSMKILDLTDSTAIFIKNISRNGRWTRTFYLKVD